MIQTTAAAYGCMRRLLARLPIAAATLAFPASALAVCDVAWDGDRMALSLAGRPDNEVIELADDKAVRVGQIWAFYEAKRRIGRAAEFFPKLAVCSDDEPNAFAASPAGGHPVVAVTVGMLQLVDGDVGVAAAVVGHEFAHHTLGHHETSQSRRSVIAFAALLAAIVAQAATGGPSVIPPHQLTEGAKLGASLIERKFDRGQEREADEAGLRHMMAAGYDPRGALVLAERLQSLGSSGSGLFFDTHPGWDERVERLHALIAADPHARQLATAEPAASDELSDAERSYNAGRSAMRAGDMQSALREFAASADGGYAPAQFTLGYFHLRGDGGLPKDEAEAVRLFHLAAEQGNANAEANYGYAHIHGLGGVDRDHIEAALWLRRAVQKDNAFAQVQLGLLYARGLQLPLDYAEAARLFALAAEQGHPLGQAYLGGLYLRGQGVERNDAEAIRLTRLAAEQGNAVGQYILAQMYERGSAGLPRDIEQAVQWYAKAAPTLDRARTRLQALGRPVPAGDETVDAPVTTIPSTSPK
jgi:TPR repeat protein